MAPRRSARVTSAKPLTAESKEATKKLPTKVAARPPRRRPAKRPAPVENETSSTLTRTKRRRTEPKAAANRDAPKAATQPKQVAAPQPAVAPFNPLPKAPTEHARPAPQLFGWGVGNFGQLGMGEDVLGEEYTKPTRNKIVEQKMQDGEFGGEDAGLEAVAAGGLFTLLLDEKGTVWSFGTNDDAALGRITANVPDPANKGKFLNVDTLTSEPYPIESLVKEDFRTVHIAAGDSIGAALDTQGDLRVWGSFRSVEGLLGFGEGSPHEFEPKKGDDILKLANKPGDVEKVSSVVAGNNHLVVLTTHGDVYAWGAGEQGQLGRKVMERRKIRATKPDKKIVLGSRTRRAVAIGAGNYTSFAVDERGTLWGWGLNNMGQAGTGHADPALDSEVVFPKKVIGLSTDELGDDDKVVQISGGEHHTLFLTSSGKVYACGRSDGGQLGLPDDHPALQEDTGMVPTPTLVPFPDEDDPVVNISAGIHNNLAVTRDGALYTWGTGPQSELGAGDLSQVNTPQMIVRREGGSWAAVAASCGGQHSVALLRKRT
ncbi:hypothetical protein EIP86_008607 [Pleurotus ostreatoroseus]|nr:hypothetical protein EIP86_008607 [Pleurotus ostreatoroseus]